MIHKRKRRNPEDRFLEKVVKTSSCWLWIGANNGRYGSFRNGVSRLVNVHKFSYEFYIEKVPEGLVIMHKCDNTLCVNPFHMSVGTQKENIHDMYKKGRDYQHKLKRFE